MLSRVADSIYWLNRYMERAENYARFIDANMNLTLDLPAGMPEQWQPLVFATGDRDLYLENYGDFDKNSVLRFLIEDKRNPSSIYSCLHRARENARGIRDWLSLDTWEHINDHFMEIRSAMDNIDPILRDPLPFTNTVRKACLFFFGLADTTVSHSEGWHFGHLGRLVERADKTSRLLDVKYFILLPKADDVGGSFDLLQWSSVLKSASAYEMFHRRFDRISPRHIAEFLILDNEFPRAVRFCMEHAEESLRKISGRSSRGFTNPAEKALGRFRSQLDYTDIKDIFNQGLHEFLDLLQSRMNEIDVALHETFFQLDDGVQEQLQGGSSQFSL